MGTRSMYRVDRYAGETGVWAEGYFPTWADANAFIKGHAYGYQMWIIETPTVDPSV